MSRSRVRLLAGVSALLLGAALPLAAAHAQGAAWPTKPVRIVVTFPPGGAPDTLARVLAEKWAPLGQPVTVENKPGAGGNIGADLVAKAPGDGGQGTDARTMHGGLLLLGCGWHATILRRGWRLANGGEP